MNPAELKLELGCGVTLPLVEIPAGTFLWGTHEKFNEAFQNQELNQRIKEPRLARAEKRYKTKTAGLNKVVISTRFRLSFSTTSEH